MEIYQTSVKTAPELLEGQWLMAKAEFLVIPTYTLNKLYSILRKINIHELDAKPFLERISPNGFCNPTPK